jgi:hypothetical protein
MQYPLGVSSRARSLGLAVMPGLFVSSGRPVSSTPSTACRLVFGERLAPAALVGMVLVAGAALVNEPGQRRA